MRFRLSGRNAADNFESLRIDHGYRLIEFGSDVEQAVLWPKDGAMRANSVSEVDGVRDVTARQIDHRQRATISAGQSDAGVAVDGNECRVTVGRCNHLVASYTTLRDYRNLLVGDGINQAESLVSLVGHEQQARG